MSRVEVEKKVLNENQILAEQLRERYRQNGILCVNLISSPGSGKTRCWRGRWTAWTSARAWPF